MSATPPLRGWRHLYRYGTPLTPLPPEVRKLNREWFAAHPRDPRPRCQEIAKTFAARAPEVR